MSKTILGLDMGSNSLGWALLSADENNQPAAIVDSGVRIFQKAVEEKTPTPKNQKRRSRRLARRTIQRRARRKRQLLNYLISLQLLPKELAQIDKPEAILNDLGDPYVLRAKALKEALSKQELGRVFLHLVQRRGFLSKKKTILGRDMLDDPDVISILEDEGDVDSDDKEESAFKADISQLKQDIVQAGCETLGEYLASKPTGECKRNRHGEHLRTDRQMYRDELNLIFERQSQHHSLLTSAVKAKIEHILFRQRPIKLRRDRVGKCSLEKNKKRAAIARLEYQRFRYLQDINNLAYFDVYRDQYQPLSAEDRKKLADVFESTDKMTFKAIRKILGLDKKTRFNLDSGVKNLRGNTTAAAIREVLSAWDQYEDQHQHDLVDDLLSIKNKPALKKRLMGHWQVDGQTAVRLCLIKLEPDYGSLSLKAIRSLLPWLEQGMIYSDARIAAGYGYETETIQAVKRLGLPPQLPNPIVNKALHELRRVVNALIAEYGKPDVIRLEMARDLEMNPKRYKSFLAQQKKNTEANEKATEDYQQAANEHPNLGLNKYPSRDQKIRHRLWIDQKYKCAYSGKMISLAALFSAEIEVDHILPYSLSLDDSYMNKVVCLTAENRNKGQQTPIDAFSGNEEKWEQITQALSHWPKGLASKRDRFYQRGEKLLERDFLGSQLTDTRYMSKEAGTYLQTLGADITFTRGVMTDWLRHQWGLNELLGATNNRKDRSDHRHHAVDAVVTACIDRPLYNTLVKQAQQLERSGSSLSMKDIYLDPPFADIKDQLREKLDEIVVAHAPQRKISGALHEDTGVGFIEGIGAVYRQRLDKDFTVKRARKIIDTEVKEIVIRHLNQHADDPKKAFAEGFRLWHKDAKTPIKRVRVVQSETSRNDLEKNKFPIKDKSGLPFKWHAYGNTHHVEVLQSTGKADTYKPIFVTALEAAHRVRGVGNRIHPLIQRDHGEDWKFLMALHINDLVSVVDQEDQPAKICRVQKLDMIGSIVTLRLHTAATLEKDNSQLQISIKRLIKDFKMAPLHVNAIGKLIDA